MKKQFTFSTSKTEEEVYQILRKYYQANRFFGFKSKKGIAFKNYGGSKVPLSPRRFELICEFDYKSFPNKNVVYAYLKMNDTMGLGRFTLIDKAFFNAFIDHIQRAVETNEIVSFDFEKYEEQAKPFTKSFWIICVAVLALGFFLAYYFRASLGSDNWVWIWIAIFGGQALAVVYANYHLKKKKKSSQLK